MSKMSFSPFPNLTTERILLRQVNTGDENEFFILKSDKRILKFLGYKAKTFDETKEFMNRINDGINKNEWILWGITLKDINELIGTICFWNICEEDSRAEIGYELIPEYQGKGIMQEAMKSIIKYGFENMKLHSIVALPNVNNSKSVKLLERSSFIRGENFKQSDSFEQVTYTLINKNSLL